MKQQFLEDKAGTIRLSVYENNRPLVPTSGTVILYKPSGSTLQASTAVSVDATTGEMTYTLTTTHTADCDLNYKALWAYVYNGTTYYETQLFDVVKSILSIPITDDDIYDELESLRKANTQETGTATSGAAGYLIDTANRKESDDYWKGGILSILNGTGEGQVRDITAYTQSTSKIEVTPDFVTNPDTTSVYQVVKSYYKVIERSFYKLEQMLYDKGKRHSLIIESSQIEFPLLYLTIHFICVDLMDDENDRWERLANLYWEKFQKTFGSLRLEYDEDESGYIDEDEEQFNPTELTIGRA